MNLERVVVEAKGLKKKYGDFTAVKDVSFTVERGECFGILGPNGAGKSTTMKMLFGATEISDGELYVLGMNAKTRTRELKQKVGVVPQEDGLEPDFSVLDNLLVFASFHFISSEEALIRAQNLLRLLKLEDYQHQKVDTLSGGTKRRLSIARGLINNPEILFLDEPTIGLDLKSRLFVWDFIKKHQEEGKTVFLTTHYMEEAESLCTRIAIVDEGKILAIDTPKNLIRDFVGNIVLEFKCKSQDVAYYSKRIQALGEQYQIYEDRIYVYVKSNDHQEQILKWIDSDNIVLRKASLNDVFLKLAGYQMRS